MEKITDKINQLLNNQERVVVAISGFGGSGKTTLAEKLKAIFAEAIWVQLDNFLIDRGQGEGWAGGYDWERFEQVLKDIKAGKALHYQAYDWQKDSLTDWYIDEKLPRVIIVEGSKILQPKLLPYYDLKVWIDCDIDVAAARGIARDTKNWENKADQVGLKAHLELWPNHWVPKEKEYFENIHPEKLADILIKT